MVGDFRGLTLWRPWAWSIAHASKRVENRPWAPPASIVGKYIALHAGKHWDYDGATRIAQVHPDMPRSADLHPVGIVAVARVVGVVRSAGELVGEHADQRLWFFGPYGWLLSGVVALPRVVPCRGAQGLWLPPEDVRARLVAALEEVTGGPR